MMQIMIFICKNIIVFCGNPICRFSKEFTIKKLSTENRELYGSVKPTEISKMLKDAENIEIYPSMIQPDKEIKSLGIFDVSLNLHTDIQSKIKIKVVAKEENE